MANFAQLLFYGQIQKNSSRIRILSENYRNLNNCIPVRSFCILECSLFIL